VYGVANAALPGCRLDGNTTVLVAFAAHVEDRAGVSGSDVADVGAPQFIGAQAGQQRGQN
jgi:hypothetical protein